MITFANTPAAAATRLTCAYYRNRFDGTLWAIRAAGADVIEAVGPLPPHFPAAHVPMAHHANPKVDVSGWSLLAFEPASPVWELAAKQRIAPGFSAPGRGRVDVQEYQGEFELKLAPA